MPKKIKKTKKISKAKQTKKIVKKNMAWTPDKIAQLKKLWTQYSASEIAEKLGNISRNAIIGKANRLGLAKPERLYNRRSSGGATRSARSSGGATRSARSTSRRATRKTTSAKRTTRGRATSGRRVAASLSTTKFVRKSDLSELQANSANANNPANAIVGNTALKIEPEVNSALRIKKTGKNITMPPSMRLNLQELGEDNCKWPEGDPSQLDSLTFCGHRPKADSPYCEYHANKARLNGDK